MDCKDVTFCSSVGSTSILGDVPQGSLQASTEDEDAAMQMYPHATGHQQSVDARVDRSQPHLHSSNGEDDNDEHGKIVSQGIDGLATACKSPLHEHNVHEAFDRLP